MTANPSGVRQSYALCVPLLLATTSCFSFLPVLLLLLLLLPECVTALSALIGCLVSPSGSGRHLLGAAGWLVVRLLCQSVCAAAALPTYRPVLE